jgi:hypothetical protein
MQRRQSEGRQVVRLDWDLDGGPDGTTGPIQGTRRMRLAEEARPDGDGDHQVLLRSLLEMVIALSKDAETHLPGDLVAGSFEQWGDGPEAYFDAVLPSLLGVNLDLCVNDGHVFVRIER